MSGRKASKKAKRELLRDARKQRWLKGLESESLVYRRQLVAKSEFDQQHKALEAAKRIDVKRREGLEG